MFGKKGRSCIFGDVNLFLLHLNDLFKVKFE